MKDFNKQTASSECTLENSTDSSDRIANSVSSKTGPSSHQYNKPSVWSGFLFSAFSVFETHKEPKVTNELCAKINCGWTEALKRIMYSGSMRRILGLDKTGISSFKSDIWLLGVCYKITRNDSTHPVQSEEFASFVEDFSSRILITYRKGFAPIEDSKYTSDVNWGCMLRSSQMLVAQAFIFHLLGRSWRKSIDKPLEQTYVRILHLFGDSEASPFSIHNLLRAGKAYCLSPGSWIGPYAMCRAWEMLSRCNTKEPIGEDLSTMITMYVVSADEDGERGGAPVVCVEDITRHCVDHSSGQIDWKPVVLMVPLVLGLDIVNPRYLSSLRATFCFPQCLGILGGRPGASTYIIGVQDDEAFFLDPHEAQPVIALNENNLDVDTTSYHCNTVRHFHLESMDPSLAIGFYCRDKGDFDDFCLRASELANQSNGAPLFTVTQTRRCPTSVPTSVGHQDDDNENSTFTEAVADTEGSAQDEWQFL